MKLMDIVVIFIFIVPLSGCLGPNSDGDGDGWTNAEEKICQTDSLDSQSVPQDHDGDWICDIIDDDDDDDGWLDYDEMICMTDSKNESSTPNDKDNDFLCDAIDLDIRGILDDFKWMGDNRKLYINSVDDKEKYALNIVTWQMQHGGWEKGYHEKYRFEYDSNEIISNYETRNGVAIGSLADQSTTGEIRFLSEVYKNSSNEENRIKFKQAVEKGIEFIFKSQNESGGWPQVYPPRECQGCEYTSLMTYNDFVIQNAIYILWDIRDEIHPFDTAIVENINITKLNLSLENGIDFILKSQIINDQNYTIWGGQHSPDDYSSEGGRSYELPCKSTAESVGTLAILINWPERSQSIINATWGAINWFHDNMIIGMRYDYDEGNLEINNNSLTWYRFYNISDDQYFMSGRDGVKVYDFNNLPDDRRTGYAWAGNWGTRLIHEISKISEEDWYF